MAFAIRRGPKLTSLSTLVLLLFCVWFLVLIPFLSRHGGLSFRPQRPNRAPPIELVVASTKHENTTWVHQHLPEWSRKVYVVDDPQNALTVPVNKGREAMVFLTYLIDNYYSLPDTVIFVHASRFQWHNDDPDYDLLPELRNLNFTYVRTVGYANLRCVWVLGCPVEIRPFADELPAGQEPQPSGRRLTTKEIFKRAFEELLPDIPVPQEVGVSCCSQFAVTRETVRQRPLEDYVHFRQWLIDTPLTDDLSGRVLEYAWHIIFGKEAIHCPRAEDCYCNLWGLCDLKCTDQQCEGRYSLPSLSTFPKGWPRIGWDGKERDYSGSLS